MKDVLVRISDDGEIEVFDARDNFMASFRHNRWVDDLLFQAYELDEFTIVQDEREVSRIMKEARTILNCPLDEGS